MIAGITFQAAGKIYEFNAGDLPLRLGDRVVVESDRGESLGRVVCLRPREERGGEGRNAFKKVLRPVSGEDLRAVERNRTEEEKALEICRALAMDRDLPMKLLKAESSLDGRKTTFYFSAEGRVDFRDLVRDLARRLRQRIEMRQVGVRDQAKLLGGFGPCGQPLCCGSFLREFVPVSIKVAKKQDATLNLAKISGVCGKLMCCLNFEADGEGCAAKGMTCPGRAAEGGKPPAPEKAASPAEENQIRSERGGRKGPRERPPVKKEKKMTLGEALDSESWNLP